MSDIRDTLKLATGLKHKHIVALEEAIFKFPTSLLMRAVNSSVAAGIYVKAAVKAGWIVEPANETGEFNKAERYFIDGVDVDEMEAWEVAYLGREVEQLYNSLTNIPKN